MSLWSPTEVLSVYVCAAWLQESLGVVRATLEAVLDATLPPGASRTVYLCDDGADPQKRHYVAGIAHLGVM
jgi:hypothetical protein